MASEPPPRMRGRSEHSLDDKGRVIMPLRFREALGDEFMLVTGPGPCLRAYPLPVFDKLERDLSSASVLDEVDSDKQMLQRLFYNGDLVGLDQQFRVTIPRALRHWAGFGKMDTEVVIIIGMGDKLELWSPTAWDVYSKALTAEAINQATDRLKAAGGKQARSSTEELERPGEAEA